VANQQDFIIQQGKTFSQVVRWETTPIVYKAISAISQAAPAAISAALHGVPIGWRVAIVSVKGMTEINSPMDSKQKPTAYRQATVVDTNTISLNDVNASGFAAYLSGGYVQYNTPSPLAGFTARMTIKDMVAAPSLLVCTTAGTAGTTIPKGVGADGTVVWSLAPAGSARSLTWTPGTVISVNAVMDTHELLRLDTVNARIVIDTVNYTITLSISAVDTAALSWSQGVYDLEMVSSAGVVTGVIKGTITVEQEVTT
jgi:hypothetical protein